MKIIVSLSLFIAVLFLNSSHSKPLPWLSLLLDEEVQSPAEETEPRPVSVDVSTGKENLSVLSDTESPLDGNSSTMADVQTKYESSIFLIDENDNLFGLSIAKGGTDVDTINATSTALSLIYLFPFDWQTLNYNFASFSEVALLHPKFSQLVLQVEVLQASNSGILESTSNSHWELVVEIATSVIQNTGTSSSSSKTAKAFLEFSNTDLNHPELIEPDGNRGFNLHIINTLFAPYGISAYDSLNDKHLDFGLRGPFWAPGIDGLFDLSQTTTDYNRLTEGEFVVCLAKPSTANVLRFSGIRNIFDLLGPEETARTIIQTSNSFASSEFEKARLSALFKGEIATSINLGARLFGLVPIKGDIGRPAIEIIADAINRNDGLDNLFINTVMLGEAVGAESAKQKVSALLKLYQGNDIFKSRSLARQLIGLVHKNKNGGQQNAILKRFKIYAKILGSLLVVVDAGEIFALVKSIDTNDNEKCFGITHRASGGAIIRDFDIPVDNPPEILEGSWQGTYTWACGTGGNSNLTIDFVYDETSKTYSGFSEYLSSRTPLISVNHDCRPLANGGCLPTIGFDSPVTFEAPESSSHVYNEFSGTLQTGNQDELILRGTTINGDSSLVPGVNGCSGIDSAGTFELTKIPQL